MSTDYQYALAFTGTGGTFYLNEINPFLGLLCGLLTLTHVCIALHRQHKANKENVNKSTPKRKPKSSKKRRRPYL